MEETLQTDLTTPLEIQLHLLTTAYFYGDFSIIYYFTNQNSPIYSAVTNKDIHALNKFATKNEIDFDLLTDEQKEQYNQFQQKINDKYRSQLETNPLPLPDQYLEDLADRAIEVGNFTTTHSALQSIN